MSDHAHLHLLEEAADSSLLILKTPLSLARLFLQPRSPVLPDANPVLLLPGLGANDLSTYWLRKHLEQKGYKVYGSGLFRNEGSFETHRTHLQDRLARISNKNGRPVDIVGWSMGGRFAVHLAETNPLEVGKITTLGSPLRTYEVTPALERAWIRVLSFGMFSVARFRKEMATDSPLPGPGHPLTAIVGLYDAVVDGRGATLPQSVLVQGAQRENIFVPKGHIGMGFSTFVRDIILDRLAQRVSSWKAYQATMA